MSAEPTIIEPFHGRPHTHDHPHTHDSEPRGPAAPALLSPSLLRLGIAGRMLLAGGLALLIWAMILGVLA
jgi:hypothetical protein